MRIIINNTSMVPIYEQIMEQIKAQIISGELKENDILPSVRTMAKELKANMEKSRQELEAAIHHKNILEQRKKRKRPIRGCIEISGCCM